MELSDIEGICLFSYHRSNRRLIVGKKIICNFKQSFFVINYLIVKCINDLVDINRK